MRSFFIKLLLKRYHPQLVVVWGNYGRMPARMVIASVLGHNYDVISGRADHFERMFWNHCRGFFGLVFPPNKRKKMIVVLECEPQQDTYHFLKRELGLAAIVITPSGDIPGFTDLFSGEESSVARFRKEIATIHQGPILVLNYDDEAVRSLGEKNRLSQRTYGVSADAHMYAGEIKPHAEVDEKKDALEAGTFAKVHVGGSVVPFHIPRALGKQHIYAALASFAVADYFGMNVVEAIEGLQHYAAPQGSGNVCLGIKGTIIVDASSGSTPFFARELLEIVQFFKKEQENLRVVVALGDLIGFGEGDEEAQLHKTLGEYIGKVAQELYLVGERVVFTEETAGQEIGADRIHRYADAKPAAEELERNLKKGDLILVVGSSGVNMKNMVEQIRK